MDATRKRKSLVARNQELLATRRRDLTIRLFVAGIMPKSAVICNVSIKILVPLKTKMVMEPIWMTSGLHRRQLSTNVVIASAATERLFRMLLFLDSMQHQPQ